MLRSKLALALLLLFPHDESIDEKYVPTMLHDVGQLGCIIEGHKDHAEAIAYARYVDDSGNPKSFSWSIIISHRDSPEAAHEDCEKWNHDMIKVWQKYHAKGKTQEEDHLPQPEGGVSEPNPRDEHGPNTTPERP